MYQPAVNRQPGFRRGELVEQSETKEGNVDEEEEQYCKNLRILTTTI